MDTWWGEEVEVSFWDKGDLWKACGKSIFRTVQSIWSFGKLGREFNSDDLYLYYSEF